MSSRYPSHSSVDADADAAGPPTVLKIGFLNYEDGASAEELREKRAEHEEAYDVLPKGDGVGVGFEHITMMVEALVQCARLWLQREAGSCPKLTLDSVGGI